ncbi:MAG: 3-oxoacyl-ACP reductase FabG [Bacteroidales bacterium]|nr:3-oxoacyl-ACP reductase FabG [Bacteroidales bacterium]
MKDLFSVKDKTVLVTGSSRGIGYSIARGFAAAGSVVLINGTSGESVKKAVKQLLSEGLRVHGIAFDVTNPAEVEKNIEKIENSVGPVDVLVNNAGIHRRAPLEDMTMEEWNKVVEADLTSVFIVSKAVAKYMITRRAGRIINITSLNAEAARPTIANYCAAKGGLKMLTKSMATEWGKYNILTNAIGPGYILTDLTKPLSDDPSFDAWVKSEVPLQRWGQPEDLAGAAIFLASEASKYINGHTIYVDGGWQACL